MKSRTSASCLSVSASQGNAGSCLTAGSAAGSAMAVCLNEVSLELSLTLYSSRSLALKHRYSVVTEAQEPRRLDLQLPAPSSISSRCSSILLETSSSRSI
eukprot:4541363-Prymnesium_polylepis.1